MDEGTRILLVEDDPALAREITRGLERAGWAIDHVTTLGAAIEAILQKRYRAILLDRRLPDGDGIGLVAAEKSRPSPAPIIFLTARDEVADRVEGLDAGADDYLVKPFAMGELLARLRVASRRPRAGIAAPPPIEVGRLSFDPSSREARVSPASSVRPDITAAQ